MNTLSRFGSIALALVLGVTMTAGCNRQSPTAAGTGSSSGASGAAGTSGTAPMVSSGSSGATAAGAASMAISDTALTANIKAAFLADSDLKSTAISVDALNGEVTLSGTLANQAQIDRAGKVAGAVAGVRSVRNQLSVHR